ncbi:MAG: hypothetical protein NT086_17520 [Proteobacteria bacterium]|nr:hypothetical protein [Pseudomonadota bacterium]
MKLQYLASLLCSLSLFTACTSDSQPEIKTGTLLKTTGVDYDTRSQHGRTTANGEYQYVDGEMVTFRIGSLVLGQVAAGAMITPLTLAKNEADAHKIMQLLLTLDEDDDANNGIQIAASDAARFVKEQTIQSASIKELLDANGKLPPAMRHVLSKSKPYNRQVLKNYSMPTAWRTRWLAPNMPVSFTTSACKPSAAIRQPRAIPVKMQTAAQR